MQHFPPVRLPGSIGQRRRARAQSLVEFGLVALLFTLLLFGIVDFGLLLNGWISVSSAAREAARTASLGYTVEEIAAAARPSTSVPGVPASQLTVVVKYEYRDSSTLTYCSTPLALTTP